LSGYGIEDKLHKQFYATDENYPNQ